MPRAMHILRAKDHVRMPWKNGGGVTTEIAVHPVHAPITSFDWRVSMATVATDGPFSEFPGVDRTLAVLEGDGLRLKIGDAQARTFTSSSDPLAFPADVQSSAELTLGPIRDLNVMTRRGRWRHSVERLTASTPPSLAVEAPDWLLLAHGGPARIETPEATVELDVGDALRGEGSVANLTIVEVTALYRIEFWPETDVDDHHLSA